MFGAGPPFSGPRLLPSGKRPNVFFLQTAKAGTATKIKRDPGAGDAKKRSDSATLLF